MKGGLKPCKTIAKTKKKKKEGHGETSEKRTAVEMEADSPPFGLKPCKTIARTKKKEEGHGETSEKRTAVEMEADSPPFGSGFHDLTEMSEMEISGLPTNNSRKKKKRKEKEKEKEKEKKMAILIDEGKQIDVKGFLSSKQRDYLVSSKDGTLVPVSTLEGKYVLICCLFIPFDLDSTDGSLCRSIQALYSHLQLIAISDFVNLVIVVKLKQDAPASAFDSFFSWFPLNCLTIPFSDSKSRHYVCRVLGLSHHPTSCHPCAAIHPTGLVLFSDSAFLQSYGARSFPFTSTHLQDITRYDIFIEQSICSNNYDLAILEELLQCDTLSQIDTNKSVPTSDLFNTPVGLYLYSDGSFMDHLRELHKTCLGKGLKFDVVVVPLPFVNHHDPVSFCDRMKQSALKDEVSSSWLLFPFHDDICRTLWRITVPCTDELIILPHGDFRGDLDGRGVASTFGIGEYPFTKDAIVQRKLNHLRSLTLDRLLGKDFSDTCELDDKNVLLYFHYSLSSRLYTQLKKGYCKIKQQYPDCQVVLVPMKPPFSNADTELDLLILPSEKCEAVIKHILTDQHVKGALCAFGKDGKLLSRLAGYCLPIRESSDPLFEDTLYEEIFDDVTEKVVDHQH